MYTPAAAKRVPTYCAPANGQVSCELYKLSKGQLPTRFRRHQDNIAYERSALGSMPASFELKPTNNCHNRCPNDEWGPAVHFRGYPDPAPYRQSSKAVRRNCHPATTAD